MDSDLELGQQEGAQFRADAPGASLGSQAGLGVCGRIEAVHCLPIQGCNPQVQASRHPEEATVIQLTNGFIDFQPGAQ
jgi:hypothetical protein